MNPPPGFYSIDAPSILFTDEQDDAMLPHLGDEADLRLTRRLQRRRRLHMLIAGSLFIDFLILLAYALIGRVEMLIAFGYLGAAFGFTALVFLLSEARIADRSSDTTIAMWQVATLSLVQAMGYFLAPEIGIVFLASVFITHSFGAMHLHPRQAWTLFAVTMAAFCAVFFWHQGPIVLPNATMGDRIITMLVLPLALGRCVVLGLYGNGLRERLYQRGQALRDAMTRIEQLAELDALTGLYNRRVITSHLDHEVLRSHRAGAVSCVALIDLDWFKRINDAFGHLSGDEVLRTFGINVFANIRAVDKFGRYGGEEFMIVMPDINAAGATAQLDRLRDIVRSLDWESIAPNLTVTFSAGVAEIRRDDTSDTALSRADSALYSAKLQGRDCVVVATPQVPGELYPSVVPVA